MSVEEINRLNAMLAEDRLDPEIQTRIAQFELAFRMQAKRQDRKSTRLNSSHRL